jgi:ketosteroid isomerase-like protein
MDAAEIVRIVEAFSDASNRHDVERMLQLVSDDVMSPGGWRRVRRRANTTLLTPLPSSTTGVGHRR